MTYEKFVKVVIQSLQDKLGKGFKVTEHNIQGNNGTVKHSLIIKESSFDVCPCINLDNLYIDFSKENIVFNDVVEQVIRIYKENAVTHNIDISIFNNWDYVCTKIYARLINTEQNEYLLTNLPHRNYLDLSFVYYVNIDEIGNSLGSIQVCNELMRIWEVDENELYHVAWKNMERNNEAYIHNITEVIGMEINFQKINKKILIFVSNGKT